jgi:cellulose biosynthesis protein BcsQ
MEVIMENRKAEESALLTVSLKGGVGKTRPGILVANFLGASEKICVIDWDINNSMSFHYQPQRGDFIRLSGKK